MQVEHGTSVVVTDGSKALLLCNEGDAEFPNLRLVRKWEQSLPSDREMKVDSPGRTFGSFDGGTRRSSYDETDFHEAAEAQFASKLADFLDDQVEQALIRELIIVAPPRTLGELRKHLSERLSNAVTAQIGKDLVKHPIPTIERLLVSYSDAI